VQKEQLLSVSSLSLSLGEKEKHMSVLYLSPKKKNTRIYFLGMRGV
jgi:hypothetical protein